MELDIYLNYGKITFLMTHGEIQNSNVPPEWGKAILHARIEIGGTVLMGADIPPDRFKPMRSAYLTLLLESDAEADRIYALLSDGGEIFMKMEETFYASRFAMLRDRFGTSWMLLHERPQNA
jgi:PhnB protein